MSPLKINPITGKFDLVSPAQPIPLPIDQGGTGVVGTWGVPEGGLFFGVNVSGDFSVVDGGTINFDESTMTVNITNLNTPNGFTAAGGNFVVDIDGDVTVHDLAVTGDLHVVGQIQDSSGYGGTNGLVLISTTSGTVWGGQNINTVSNSDGTLTVSPTQGDVVASLNLSNANTWIANQTFGVVAINNELVDSSGYSGTDGYILYSTNGGSTTNWLPAPVFDSVSNSDGTLTISPTTGTIVASLNLNNANTWTADQEFAAATFLGTAISAPTDIATQTTFLQTRDIFQSYTSVSGMGAAIGSGLTVTFPAGTYNTYYANVNGRRVISAGATVTVTANATGTIYLNSSGMFSYAFNNSGGAFDCGYGTPPADSIPIVRVVSNGSNVTGLFAPCGVQPPAYITYLGFFTNSGGQYGINLNYDASGNSQFRSFISVGTYIGANNALSIYSTYLGTAIGLNAGSVTPSAYLHLQAGTATAGTAPFKLNSGTNLTTAETGAMEYDGTNLFFTRTGTTRESVFTGVSGASAPSTNTIGILVSYYGTSATVSLNTPNSWASVVIGGSTFKIPLYS